MTKVKFEVEAEIRNDLGKGASRRLRRQEKVPAIVYGAGKEAQALALDHRKITKALENEAFYSHILTLKNGTDSERVILKDLQRHPFKPRILHVDFLRVRADEKLTMNVPLHFVGGEKAPGAKAGGTISHLLTDVEIACFPDDLPEFLEVDISTMALNDVLHLSDLKLPKGVEITGLTPETDQAVVSIYLPRVEEETPSEAPVSAEVPATAQKTEGQGGSSGNK